MTNGNFFRDLEESSNSFAKARHEEKYVYGLYGLIDAPSVSYGAFKTLYSLWVEDDSDPHGFHNFITSPIGCAAVILVTVPLIALSYLGNTVDDADKDAFTKFKINPTPLDTDDNLYARVRGFRWDDKKHCISIAADAPSGNGFMRYRIDPKKLGTHAESIAEKIKNSNNPELSDEEKQAIVTAVFVEENTLYFHWDEASQCIIAVGKYKNARVRFRVQSKTLGSHADGIIQKIKQSDAQSLTEDETKAILAATAQRDNVAIRHYLAVYHPFLRDVIKGLKNTFKGMSSTLQIGELLLDQRLHYLLLPTTLVLGAVLAGVRLALRNMRNERKKVMDYNADLLMKIRNNTCSVQEFEEIKEALIKQSKYASNGWLVAAATGGMIDSLYLYVGVLCLVTAPWAPGMLMFLVACSTLYALICIATRVYEEYEYQRLLIATQVRIELEMLRREILDLLHDISEHPSQTANDIYWKDRQDLLLGKLSSMDDAVKRLNSYSSFSSSRLVVCYGLQNGLAVYGASVSAALMVAMILSLFGFAIPQVAVIICVVSGLFFLAAFLLHAYFSFDCPGVKPSAQIESASISSAHYNSIRLGTGPADPLGGELLIYLNEEELVCSAALKSGDTELLCIEALLGSDAEKIRKMIKDANGDLSQVVLQPALQAQIFHVLASKGYIPPLTYKELIAKVKRDNVSRTVDIVNQELRDLNYSAIDMALLTYMAVKAPPQLYTQSLAEIVRAGCSGMRQGQKVMGFIGAVWDVDETSFHDMSHAEKICLVSMAVLYSGVLAVRAHARAFGKPKPGTIPSNSMNEAVYVPHTSSMYNMGSEIIPSSPETRSARSVTTMGMFGSRNNSPDNRTGNDIVGLGIESFDAINDPNNSGDNSERTYQVA